MVRLLTVNQVIRRFEPYPTSQAGRSIMLAKLRDLRIYAFFFVALLLLGIGSCVERVAFAQNRSVDSLRGNTHNGFFGPERDFSQRFTYRNNIEPLESTRQRQQFFQSPAQSFNRSSGGGGISDAGALPYFGVGDEAGTGAPEEALTLPGAFSAEPDPERQRWLDPKAHWPSEEQSTWFSSHR